jgi:mono/diheme cytochrome c family protein
MRLRPAILAICVLALAGCGGEKTVAPKPVTVVGAVPKQSTTSGATTTSGGTKSGGGGPSGKAVFASNGCASCHTFKPAGSNASIGPDLDKLPQYAKQANQPLDKFIRESIVNPNAYVQKGFPKGVMPTFAGLPPDQLDALVTFLSQGS